MVKLCKNCELNEAKKYSKYTTGDFCSKKCSKSYGIKQRYENDLEYRKRISDGLKLKYQEDSSYRDKQRVKAKEMWSNGDFDHVNWVDSGVKSIKNKRGAEVLNIYDVSDRTRNKILNRLLDNGLLSCSNCGWSDGLGDLHHIHGRNIDDPHNHENLSYLCPNCHRLVHQNKLEVTKIISFKEQLGEDWRKFYYG